MSTSEDNELSFKLSRRQNLNDALAKGEHVEKTYVKPKLSVHQEFPEFEPKQIREYESKFKEFNISKCGKMSLEEFKSMMEKLGVPQTHLSLKSMIREVDQDNDGMITFREFMSIFRKFAAGELEKDSGLETLAQKLEVNVNEVGVGGAKSFFEAKISAARRDSQYGRDVFLEEEEKKQDLEELKSKQQAFKAKAAMFETR